MLTEEIINKYNKPAPRYTSYPPANFFTEKFTSEDYRFSIMESNNQHPQHISIYIHIPFCHSLCYYCGCNSMLLKNKYEVKDYINALKKEMRLVLPMLDKGRKISQIHYGGGSPTSQPIEVIKELNDLILSEFQCIDNPEIAIECHPGYLDEQYWINLAKAGFNRISLGIQDFDEDVLHASHRKSSRMPEQAIMDILQSNEISVNMDFMFGLPLQTKETFSQTIDKAIKLHPDRLVTFSYAHVPWVNELQKKLEPVGLPKAKDKDRMFETAKSKLTEAGYRMVGMDHFVLPADELYQAQLNNDLHRNFQGYCTRRTTGQVYAFGITGISQLAAAYSQNVRDIPAYISMVDNGKLPVLRGYKLNQQEQVTREIITRLMCNYTIKWAEIAKDLQISVNALKSSVIYDDEQLKEFEDDNIIEYKEDGLTVLPKARPFVRIVAASMDKLMKKTDKHFSRSL